MAEYYRSASAHLWPLSRQPIRSQQPGCLRKQSAYTFRLPTGRQHQNQTAKAEPSVSQMWSYHQSPSHMSLAKLEFQIL